MTTAQPTPRTGKPVFGPLSVVAAVGFLLVVVAALASGSSAAAGAAIGAVLVCVVFVSGTGVVGVVSTVAPAASLLVALLTYTLQVLAVALVYVGLSRSGALDGPVDPMWLSAAVIACTLLWTVTQIVVSMRVRQPIYDLDHGTEARAR